ncbi:glycoside hydrolase superfamily [Coprinopsis sp. MPI-PUGE-AT-0042]|nr:glycoside hydrolase superfamily [Coprinopsis sp. MPI-PUGE-AT-0042]
MLANSSSRATFISSVKSFIGNYGLNGVDIDLEYPAAQERAAPAEDTPNLTSLFSEMRSSLGTGTIISLATPAGYWFLRGFQLDKIQNSLDYFNMMSYDYHGPWDLNVSGEDGTAKPQTDTRDITTSMNLYKQIGVKFDKLNLGLAWYGRSYAVVEVWREIKANNIKPTLDSASSTYWYNYNGDFITYDDTETWNKKTQMAGNTCFGGTFVWCVFELCYILLVSLIHTLYRSLDQTTPSTPPPVVEDYDVTCQHIASKEVLDACKVNPFDFFHA